MISFKVGNDKFNFRVSGIFIDKSGKRFLTNTGSNIDFHVLPGGRVEMGEDSKTALAREMEEELGCKVNIKSLKIMTENFFSFDDANYHELQYVYIGEILDDEIEKKEGQFMGIENKDIYEWATVEDLEKINYTPKHLRPYIIEALSGNTEFRHVINKGNG